MMLEWLGEGAAAARIRAAVRSVFQDRSARTRDMGGTLSTTQMPDAILAGLA
jgi:isocitrate/isopropylmalate dehydrogenase